MFYSSRTQKFWLSLLMLVTMVAALAFPTTVRADDETTPPTDTPVVTETPVAGSDETASLADTVVVPETPVVGSDDNGETSDLSAIVQVLADTDSVLVDENGNPVSLFLQKAADILSAPLPDPIVCPSGTTAPDPLTCTYGFTKITDAVTAATPGSVIFVQAGIYAEQVVLDKSLTLIGDGASSTTIQAPASMVVDTNGNHTIVQISGTGTMVEISGFAIQGPWTGLDYGIYVRGGANAYIHDNEILDIRDNTFSGNQYGVAIEVGRSANSTTGTAVIDNNLIEGFQKNAITVSNTGSSATVTNNVITGAGPTAITAQNGIQVSSGATAVVDGNTVSGIYYTGPNWTASGILLSSAGDGTSVTNNDLTGAQAGVYVSDSDNATVSGNTVDQSSYGIEISTSNNASVTNNTVSNSETSGIYVWNGSNNATITGNLVINSAGDGLDLDSFYGTAPISGASISGNTISNSAYDGLWAGGTNSNLTITNNQFTNNGKGLIAAGDPAAGALHLTGAVNLGTLAITGNAFYGSNKTGVSNQTTGGGAIPASNNWWGCAGGPGTPGCDSTYGLVSATPWLATNPFGYVPPVQQPAGPGDEPPGGQPPAAPKTPVYYPPFIPVTGGELVDISSVDATTTLQLGQQQIMFQGLGGYQASVEDVPQDTLPGDLPAAESFVTSLAVNLLKDGAPVDLTPTGASITVSFQIPADMLDKTFTIMYWDAKANNNLGAWVALPVKVEGSTDPMALYPDMTADERAILSGIEITPDGFVKVKVNFPGTFTLVTP